MGLLACCIVVQTLIAGLHAAHFIEQQFVANDASICHGGNTAPSLPRSDLADPCCPQGCIAGPAALLPRPTAILPRRIVAATTQQPVQQLLALRSHLIDRAHSRPRSPPSA